MNYIKVLFAGALCSLLCVSCNEQITVVIDDTVTELTVDSFYPTSGEVGDEITITGENLDIATSVSFGGGDALIMYRLSSQQIIVIVTTETRSGAISVSNNFGETDTCDGSFSVDYKTPTITSSATYVPYTIDPVVSTSVSTFAESGAHIEFTGTNLHVIDQVMFGDYEASVISSRSTELVVKVPTTPVSMDTKLSITYYNGSAGAIDCGDFHIISIEPQFTDIVGDIEAYIYMGQTRTLTGTNLDQIDYFYVIDEEDSDIIYSIDTVSQSATSISFALPSDFEFDEDAEEGAGWEYGLLWAKYYNEERDVRILGEYFLYESQQ